MSKETKELSFIQKVAEIQGTLKAPKGQMNKFGGYKFRSCEDIVEAVKPLLTERGLILTINDELVQSGDRFYIKATATITDGDKSVSNSALARESEEKKGMDTAQVTGACSSYARKYALNGLLLIDDTKDADATETHGKEESQAAKDVGFTQKAKDWKVSKKTEPVATVEAVKEEATKKTFVSKSEVAIAEATTPAPAKKGWSSSRKTPVTNVVETKPTNSKGDLY